MHVVEELFSEFECLIKVFFYLQFVFGNAYYFEYTIQETVCTKCMTDVDLNQCKIEKFPVSNPTTKGYKF